MPGNDLIGLNAVHSFCGAVEFGSRVLKGYLRFPMLVGGSLLLVTGSVAITGLVVLRDLARGPLVGRETAGFLRHRRSLGQMIRAALIVYGRHARVFLGIAFEFIPIDLALTLFQDKLYRVPPIETLVWLLDGGEVSKLIVGLLVGGLASFAVYLFAVSGAIAAIDAIDAGRPTGVRLAYRAALKRAHHVVLGRVRTLAAIAVLGLSIVGLPLAVWLAVRWFFVEEAALLDGESHWRAPGASSHAVDGRWLRALRLVFSFGVFGALAGPLLAFGLLLGTGLDPALVNIFAGLFHTAALPFTALGLCLAYRDLQVRAVEAQHHEQGKKRQAGVLRGFVRRLTAPALWVLHALEGRRRR